MNAGAMQRAMASIWWQVLLRGFISLLLGVLMLVWPDASVQVYEEIFGAYALVDGFLLILQVLPVRQVDKRVWSRLLHGVIGVGVGTAVFLWPEFREIGMSNIFSTYLMLTGVLQVFTALDLYRVVRYDYYFIASGFLSIFCGLLLKTVPVNRRGTAGQDFRHIHDSLRRHCHFDRVGNEKKRRQFSGRSA